VSFSVRYPRQAQPARRRARPGLRTILRSHDLGEPLDTEGFESVLRHSAESSHLLSAIGQGTRMELTYGVRPRRGQTNLQILQELRREPSVEHAELFDAKHQVEF